jgi:hypothetical protein|tara:strand:+ start:399 stop:830 length:432 start_codon:yes stop_codon:yes gene_type:complete
MKQSYIKRISYKSLRYANPSLNIKQLKSMSNKIVNQHKSRILHSDLVSSKFEFDILYLKKLKPSCKLKKVSRLNQVGTGSELKSTSYSNIFSLENTLDPSTHGAWLDESLNETRQQFSHILLSTETVKKGSRLDKFQQKFTKK